MTAWSVMAQWCLPQIYSEPHEPVCWLDPRDETTKSWIHVLLKDVVHTDGVDYFTAQHAFGRADAADRYSNDSRQSSPRSTRLPNLCYKWGSTGDPNDGPYDHTHPAASLRQMGGKKACEVCQTEQDPDDLATISHPGSRGGERCIQCTPRHRSGPPRLK